MYNLQRAHMDREREGGRQIDRPVLFCELAGRSRSPASRLNVSEACDDVVGRRAEIAFSRSSKLRPLDHTNVSRYSLSVLSDRETDVVASPDIVAAVDDVCCDTGGRECVHVSVDCIIGLLHYIKVIYSGIMDSTAKPLCTRCTELYLLKAFGKEMIGKRQVLKRSEKKTK